MICLQAGDLPSFLGTLESQQTGAVVMYDCSNGATAGQVLDFTHHWEAGILFRLGLIFPVAQLTRKEQQRRKRAKRAIKLFWEKMSMFTREMSNISQSPNPC